jgi:hypothetical protein
VIRISPPPKIKRAALKNKAAPIRILFPQIFT